VRQAIARDLPVLAVCCGMQVLNVALGGDLRQHLPDLKVRFVNVVDLKRQKKKRASREPQQASEKSNQKSIAATGQKTK